MEEKFNFVRRIFTLEIGSPLTLKDDKFFRKLTVKAADKIIFTNGSLNSTTLYWPPSFKYKVFGTPKIV